MTQLLQVKLEMGVSASERVGRELSFLILAVIDLTCSLCGCAVSAIARDTPLALTRGSEKGGVASDLDALESSIAKLQKLLDDASKYVDDVVVSFNHAAPRTSGSNAECINSRAAVARAICRLAVSWPMPCLLYPSLLLKLCTKCLTPVCKTFSWYAFRMLRLYC